MQIERNVANQRWRSYDSNGQNWVRSRSLRGGRRGVNGAEIAPDHKAHQLGLTEELVGREAATVRPSRITVISSEMANTSSSRCETNTTAQPGLEPGDHVEQALDFARAQRRRRLVEDDQVGLQRQRLGDFDELALRHRQAAHLEVERERRRPARGRRVSPARAPHRSTGEPAGPRNSGRKMFSSTDRSGARLVSCITMAMPASSASRGDLRVERAGRVIAYRAAVATHVTGDDAGERRLAGAVGAEQRMGLAGAQRRLRAGERAGAARNLADFVRIEQKVMRALMVARRCIGPRRLDAPPSGREGRVRRFASLQLVGEHGLS